MTDGFRAGTDAEGTAGGDADGFRGLKLYDTLAREKRDFLPIDWAAGSAVPEAQRRVRMYVCGPTVYDFAHIGNARPVIVFDVLYRLLRHLYGPAHVAYVRNVTDVDDKINARAARDFPDLPLNEAIARVTATTEAQFHEDVAALGCLPPNEEPRATAYIGEMKALIERLVAAGHAYVGDGHVLFDVASMPDYGRLSRRSTDDLIAGARVDVAPYKKGPMDFVLWKPSGPGEPGWPGPCGLAGLGRPGWHIECSAMSRAFLGDVFDIHGGGIDLVFPHHENEIAQSRCALGTPTMANYWMHNGFLMVEGEKMSKSLGNFTTIRDVLKDWPGDVVRLNMLKTHYRQPIDWTVRGLEESERVLKEWVQAADEHPPTAPAESVVAALRDDLNTPRAIAEIHALRNRVAHDRDAEQGRRLAGTLAFLGVRPADLARAPTLENADAVETLIAARTAAKKAKNFAEADRIRDELAAMGVQLKDGKDGTTWEVMR